MSTEKKQIAITISGLSAVGKSTIMEKIYRMLWTEGYDVELNLNSDLDYSSEMDFRRQMANNNAERQQAVKEKSKITLYEVHSRHTFNITNESQYKGQD